MPVDIMPQLLQALGKGLTVSRALLNKNNPEMANAGQPTGTMPDPSSGMMGQSPEQTQGQPQEQAQTPGQYPGSGQPQEETQNTPGTMPATGQSNLSGGISGISSGVPNLTAPMQSEVAQAAIESGVQPSTFLDRLTGLNLEGEELANWQKGMGIASLLSALGAGVGKDSLFGRYSKSLHDMQAGALLGQNATQAQKAANAMSQASAGATSGLPSTGTTKSTGTSNYTVGDSSTYGTISPEDMDLVRRSLLSYSRL